MIAPFRIENLVFQFAGRFDYRWLDERGPEGMWMPACDVSVRRLFSQDASRYRKFLRFLRAGCFGYFLERDGQWIAYGWCTQPGSGYPPHLPRWSGKLGAFWIFYCHTREEFRGQGHYQRLLARLVAGARERAEDPLLLCDTLPENFASRSAVLKSGFAPMGVLTAYRPVRGVTVGGGWRRDRVHLPRLAAKRTASSGQAA